MAHVADWKKQEVAELRKLINDYPVIGVVNIGPVPGRQIQRIRASLRGEDTQLLMSRKRLITRAIQGSKKKNIEKLTEHFSGQGGLIFSKTNPFKIYKNLEKSKTRAPAKPNSIASADIKVSKGETSFPPGPILSELQQGGVPAAIQGGKVVIRDDAVLVKAGERISPAVANALARLEIEPVEIKLDLLAAYEDGTIYTSSVLAVDSKAVQADMVAAHQKAVNLSIYSGYITKQTASIAISQAVIKARNLAINAAIYEKDVMGDILARAHSQAKAVEALTGEKIKSTNENAS